MPVELLDADVEARNCHLFLNPTITTEKPVNIMVPQVDEEKCTYCGACADICEFNAIAVFGKSILVFPELCHACGGCARRCPEGAIKNIPYTTGTLYLGAKNKLQFGAGQLNIGEAKAPPVIKALKNEPQSHAIRIIDAPPGTACPAVEAMQDSDMVILVTEPTPFGMSDLKLTVELVRKLDIPFGIVINRSDIGDDRVESYCREEHIPVLMRLPHDQRIAGVYSNGELVVERLNEYEREFYRLYKTILGVLES
jgi:MinD superfamily P-loop ATPase